MHENMDCCQNYCTNRYARLNVKCSAFRIYRKSTDNGIAYRVVAADRYYFLIFFKQVCNFVFNTNKCFFRIRVFEGYVAMILVLNAFFYFQYALGIGIC